MDKSLTKLSKMWKMITQNNKSRDEEGGITRDTKKIQRMMKSYFKKNLLATKLQMYFLDTYHLPVK